MAVSMGILLFSCKQEKCDDFHEGQKCELEIRKRYYGKYNGILSPAGANPQTEMVLVAGGGDGPRYISVNGFRAFLVTPAAFEIQHPIGAGQQISGDGFFSGKKISYWYKIGSNGPINEFAGTLIY